MSITKMHFLRINKLAILILLVFFLNSCSIPINSSNTLETSIKSNSKEISDLKQNSNINDLKSTEQNIFKPQHDEILPKEMIGTLNTSNFNVNLSLANLKTYLDGIYEGFSFRDTPNPKLSYHSSLASVYALNILKMTGLDDYVVTSSDKTSIINNYNYLNPNGEKCGSIPASNTKKCGFSVDNTVNNPSLAGTYGALLSISLLGNPANKLGAIKADVARWLLQDKLKVNSSFAAFIESNDMSNQTPIISSFFGIISSELLDITNSSLAIKFFNTIQSFWVKDTNFYRFYDYNDGVSTIEKNFYAIQTLLSLNRTSPGLLNSTWWNQIKSNLSSWIKQYQVSEGNFFGSFKSPDVYQPNIVDTGSVLALYNILNASWAENNVSNAINFVLSSQFVSKSISTDASNGGWGFNNLTYNLSDPLVNTRNTYFAILGLYASGYLSEYTNVTIESDYGKSQTSKELSNHIIAGVTPSYLYIKATTIDGFTLTNLKFTNLVFSNWNISPLLKVQLGNDFEYKYNLSYSPTNNWTWGIHYISGNYQINDYFSPINIKLNFKSLVVVQPSFNVLLVNFTNPYVKPGQEITGQINLDNKTLNPNNLTVSQFGNFSTLVFYPNGTSTPVSINNTQIIDGNVTKYYFNNTLPNDAPLGEYYFNISLNNGSNYATVIYPFMVNETVSILSLNGNSNPKNALNFYPGSSVNLTFNIAYSNDLMNPDAIGYIYFINNASKLKIFYTELLYKGDTSFQTNLSRKIPNQLLMGYYNLSIVFTWNSSLQTNSFNTTLTNSTLPYAIILGTPTIMSDQFNPGDIVQIGDNLNFTAKLVLNINGSMTNLDQKYELLGKIFYQTDDNIVLNLTYTYLSNGYGQLTGTLNPNLQTSIGSSKDYYLKIEFKMNSTLAYEIAKNQTGNDYVYQFALKGDFVLSSIDFIQGSSVTSKIETPVVIINFQIKNINNNKIIGFLELNGSLSIIGGNTSTPLENPIVPVEGTNTSFYQIQIPTQNLNITTYNISIFTVSSLKANTFLGNISLSINNDISTNGPVFAEENIFIFVFF
ncbi:MAG: hypothetical protein ACFFD1_12645, partial [Candidatus Thorarchaeota archaeon]